MSSRDLTSAMERERAIASVREHLVRRGFPRLQMLLLVTLTGASGLGASALFLYDGMDVMWQRYLLAFGVAYLVFLLLLWLWLWTKSEDYLNALNWLPNSSGSASQSFHGAGGSFGGAGAGGGWDSGVADTAATVAAPDVASAAGEIALPLMVMVLIGVLLLGLLTLLVSLVWGSPLLFAELLVDGALSASLYRRLRRIDSPHWLQSAIARTAWPFFIAAVLVAGLGGVLQHYAPSAHTLGSAVHAVHWR